MNGSYMAQFTGIIVIFLYDGKVEQSWASYQDFLGVDDFAVSAEAYAAENLLEAFRSADVSAIQAQVKQGNCWKALDVQVSTLVESYRVLIVVTISIAKL